MYAPSVSWRDTARLPRLAVVDARLTYALLVFAVHISGATFVIAILSMLLFGVLERIGYPLEVLLRKVRCRVVGRIRPSVNPATWRRNLTL